MARCFDLRHDERLVFNDGWTVYEHIVQFSTDPNPKERQKELNAASQAEIDAAMGRVKDAIDGHPSDQQGHRYVRHEPLAGRKYVVFSDHHYTYTGHRTNFFGQSLNLQLYAAALAEYHKAGFWLIENGDVEDLVIFDPTWEPGEVAARAQMTFDELQARRAETRLAQLKKILDDPANAELVAAVSLFDKEKRLVRVAGNHDYDLQADAFLAVLQQTYPNVQRPSDYVLLSDAAGVVRYAVMHGHQFDLATNPVSAPRIGETTSESLGLYFQGPDRVWRWTYDDVGLWATGQSPFRDVLAADSSVLQESDELEVHLAATKSRGAYDIDRHASDDDLRAFLERAGMQLVQDLFKQEIGWDYFKSIDPVTGLVDPVEAIAEELIPGDRWFKYRILDEEFVRTQLLATFTDPATRPTLVFGHSHEVRAGAWSTAGKAAFPEYFNSAAAGRWENLLWAIEIDESGARVVSWSRVPPPSGPVQRRVWSLEGSGQDTALRASRDPQPLASS